MPDLRWEATRGDTVRLGIRFEQNQTLLIDPFLISKVEILNPSDVVIATFTTGWIQEAVGVWYLDWPIPADATLGLYHDRWTWQPYSGYDTRADTNGFAVFADGATGGDADGDGDGDRDSCPQYLTAAEVKDRGYLDIGTLLTDSQINHLSRMATRFVENATGRIFCPWAGSVDVDGSGHCYQALPAKYQIRSLTSIEDLEGTATIEVSSLKWRGSRIFHRDWRPPRCGCGGIGGFHFLGCDDCFPCGVLNIRVTGVFGSFAVVPELIKHAIGLMVKAGGVDDTITAPWIVNYQTESVDGQSVNYRVMDNGSGHKAMTGLPEVDAILNQYQNRIGRIASLSR